MYNPNELRSIVRGCKTESDLILVSDVIQEVRPFISFLEYDIFKMECEQKWIMIN